MVVKRDRPEADHALTYVKQSVEPDGDAGEQYTGLDRFGRVVDQRWTLDAGGHADRSRRQCDASCCCLHWPVLAR